MGVMLNLVERTAIDMADVCGPANGVFIENYQHILGDHRSFFPSGTIDKIAVSGETPNAKVSTNVIKLTCNVNLLHSSVEDFAQAIFTHEFEATTASKDYKYWIYNDTGDTLNNGDARANVWLKCEYVSAYDDTSEYVIKEEYSTEIDIADAADADDWDYLSVTGIQPASEDTFSAS